MPSAWFFCCMWKLLDFARELLLYEDWAFLPIQQEFQEEIFLKMCEQIFKSKKPFPSACEAIGSYIKLLMAAWQSNRSPRYGTTFFTPLMTWKELVVLQSLGQVEFTVFAEGMKLQKLGWVYQLWWSQF